jgi:hypothetical protein
MKLKSLLLSVSLTAALSVTWGAAQAGPLPVTAMLSANYYEVLDSANDPDFNTGTFPTVAAGSALGPNGLPVATGVNDLDSSGEITWWSPSLNTNVASTGTGTIALPYSSNMFPPNSTGGDDSTGFETAVFKGKFDLTGPESVTFNLQSDDDSFIYVDGTLIGQNAGVHGVTGTDFSSGTLASGMHSIEVFYADRENTGAFLSLSLDTTGVVVTPGVPEPATWAVMLMGFGGLGAAMRSRRKQAEAA